MKQPQAQLEFVCSILIRFAFGVYLHFFTYISSLARSVSLFLFTGT